MSGVGVRITRWRRTMTALPLATQSCPISSPSYAGSIVQFHSGSDRGPDDPDLRACRAYVLTTTGISAGCVPDPPAKDVDHVASTPVAARSGAEDFLDVLVRR